MPPKHIAQTSTEVKKAYKKNGPAISERTHKQLQRGYDLEQRAAREREAEKRRKLAKDKREERERKERVVRQESGVGLATQLIGYSHTQANLKKGMESFLGISKKKKQEDEGRRREEERRKEEELAKKLENITQDIEKEPFDEDDDMYDAMLDLPATSVQDGGSWADDELDDNALLEVHDLVVSDPVEEPMNESISIPPRPATAPPTPHKQTLHKSQHSSSNSTAQDFLPESQKIDTAKEDIGFTRTHGPINKVVESALEKLPGEIVELLSQDAAVNASEWMPAHGLLYKLNPIGLPPHRLRIKVGCVVVCLRDLNTSSQLSKSQHVRVLRVENERLECLTLDGQLAGTKTVITRVLFPAKYRNDDRFPFTRTQYPVRVATDYTSKTTPREAAPSGFKLPSINGTVRPPTAVKRPTPPSSKPKPQVSSNPSFKPPGLPASKIQASAKTSPPLPVHPAAPALHALDGWDDFLESGTQIARELSADAAPKKPQSEATLRPSLLTESVPLLSAQDFDFSLDDLDDGPKPQPAQESKTTSKTVTKAPLPTVKTAVPNRIFKSPPSVPRGPLSRTANIRRINPEPDYMPPPLVRPQKSVQSRSKRPMAPPPQLAPSAKKLCVSSIPLAPPSLPARTTPTSIKISRKFADFGISTQEASSFFDDDDDFALGSPPIAV